MYATITNTIVSRYNVEAPDESIWTVITYSNGSAQVFALLEHLDRYILADEDSALDAIESGNVLDHEWQLASNGWLA